MIIGFSTLTYSLSGHVMVEADLDSDTRNTDRRVSRRATLDGGATFTDDGFAHADRTFRITCSIPPAPADLTVLRSLHRNNTQVLCITDEGVFSGVINRFNEQPSGAVSLSFLVKEKLSDDE